MHKTMGLGKYTTLSFYKDKFHVIPIFMKHLFKNKDTIDYSERFIYTYRIICMRFATSV